MASFKRRLTNRLHPWLTRLFGYLAYTSQCLAYYFNRLTVDDIDTMNAAAKGGRVIYACWHGRLHYLSIYYAKVIRPPVISVLVSQSRDGDYGTAAMHHLGADAVRGSTSRGGRAAIRTIKGRLEQGNNVVITPDGPRGPAFQAQVGILKLAQLTGLPIIPLSCDASRKLTLKSWDKFIIPLPFGRVHIAHGDVMRIPRSSTAEEIESYRQTLETALRELDLRCAEAVRRA